jgi:putative hydrolase of the HAD superfamily
MIKAITFDFWQTLYADSPELRRQRQAMRTYLCHQFLVASGHNIEPSQVDVGFQAAYNLAAEMWHQHRGVTVEACILRLLGTLGIHPSPPVVDDLVQSTGEACLNVRPVLIPYVKDALAQLSTKYQLAIISDTGLTPSQFLRRLMAKDDILDNFAVQPGDAVHIGDLVWTDIVGAKNAGMKAVRFSGVSAMEGDDELSHAAFDDYRQLDEILNRL